MKPGDKNKSVLAGLIARMRDDKRTELAVYGLILAAALIIFAAGGGISCTGRGNPTSDETPVLTAPASSQSGMEARLAAVLQGISGAGRVEVMIAFGEAGEDGSPGGVSGVIVLAEGADSIRVRTDIQTAVRTLLGIDAARIGVYKLGSD